MTLQNGWEPGIMIKKRASPHAFHYNQKLSVITLLRNCPKNCRKFMIKPVHMFSLCDVGWPRIFDKISQEIKIF